MWENNVRLHSCSIIVFFIIIKASFHFIFIKLHTLLKSQLLIMSKLFITFNNILYKVKKYFYTSLVRNKAAYEQLQHS